MIPSLSRPSLSGAEISPSGRRMKLVWEEMNFMPFERKKS
jgi:hypothetical protein